MKLLSSDLIVAGISTVVISTFSALLYADFSRKITVEGAQEVGTITYKKRVAQRKYSNQVIWEAIDQKAAVYNNDTIRTSEVSEAVIQLKDGTMIELDENSMILLAQSEDAININFTQGTIYAKRGAVGDKDVKELNITSKETTVSFDKSDIKLSKDEKEDLNLTVTEGKAKVLTGEQETVVKQDQRAVISSETKEAKVDDIIFKLLSPAPNQRFISGKAREPVSLSWEPIKEKAKIYCEVASDRSFKNIIRSSSPGGNSTTENLGAGSFYWRLRAENADGNSSYSEERKFSIILDQGVQLVYPRTGETFKYRNQLPIVNFRWSENEIATEYSLEIARDANFTDKVFVINTPLTAIAYDKLDSGKYYWRIRSKVSLNNLTYSGNSAVSSFHIKRLEDLEPAYLVFPTEGKKISSVMAEKDGVPFSWRSEVQVPAYQLLVARDRNFTNTVYSDTITTNFKTIKQEIVTGKYFWKVYSLDRDGEIAARSAVRSLMIVKAAKIRLVAPGGNFEKKLDEGTKETEMTFSWEKSEIGEKYLIEVSRDSTFLSTYHTRIIQGTSAVIAGLNQGNFYWRVKLLDSDNSVIVTSESRMLNIVIPIKEIPGIDAAVAVKDAEDKEIQEKPKVKPTILTVETPVKKSSIYVNDRLVGSGKISIPVEPGKKSVITVTARGFDRNTAIATLSEGEKRTIRVPLTRSIKHKRVKWVENVRSPVLVKPVYNGDKIVIATDGGLLISMDKNGRRKWTFNCLRRIESTPVVSKGNVYVVSNAEYLFCVDAARGTLKWKKKIFGTLLFGSSPVVVGDRIYVASSYGRIYGFSNEGKELWQKDIQTGIFSSPAFSNGYLYIGADDQHIYCISAGSGKIKWKFKTDSRIVSSSPIIVDNKVITGSYNGTFYAVHTRRGKLKWSFKAKDSILSAPLVHKDRVYFGSVDEYLYCLDLDEGELIWKFKTGDKITATPVILKNHVYISSGNTIYAVNMETGKKGWSHNFPYKIKTGVEVVKDNLIVGLGNGQVASIRTSLRDVLK